MRTCTACTYRSCEQEAEMNKVEKVLKAFVQCKLVPISKD